MRTIAVFHAVIEDREHLWYCELEDVGGRPCKGDAVVHEHSLYEVTRVHVAPAAREQGGELRSGDAKLLEILNTLYGGAKAIEMYVGLRNVGSGDAPKVTDKGLVIANKALVGAFDNAVMCTVKRIRTIIQSTSFDALISQVQKATGISGKPVTGVKSSSASLEPILIEDPSGSGDAAPE